MGRHKGSRPELAHLQTPPEKRNAEWWLAEHGPAEQAVTSAAAIQEYSKDDTIAYVGRRLLDVRLDWLALVDDTCDLILLELEKIAPPEVADACRRHFMGGETWVSAARHNGVDHPKLYFDSRRWLSRVDIKLPDVGARGLPRFL